jgi:signal transduction histidine kinase
MNASWIRYGVVVVLVAIALASFLYTQFLIDRIVDRNRAIVELWARAIEYISAGQTVEGTGEFDFVASELVIQDRFQIPSLVADADGNILIHRNIPDEEVNPGLVRRFAAMNDSIRIAIPITDTIFAYQYVYYGETATVRSLRIFPYIQFGLLSLILGLAYISLMSIRRNEQSRLWVGMAREAAHQLGTPLSSLLGWITLLKSQPDDADRSQWISELEEDAQRLELVAERFNKIGSSPALTAQRVAPVVDDVADYIRRRLPRFGKDVTLTTEVDPNLKAAINTDLLIWALENLLKNALDAIESESLSASITICGSADGRWVILDVADTGKGIEKKDLKEVFKPGYSTKRRGWGLGLTLTRRIIEEYHDGRVFVLKSAPGEGTTMRVKLRSQESE